MAHNGGTVDDGMHCKTSFLLALSIWFCGCALLRGGISYFDPTTYRNLTEVKPQVIFLYETFMEDSIDHAEVRSIRLQLAQMHEYEKGKGADNLETAEQIDIIRKMFDEHVAERRRNGPWNAVHMKNQVENITEAFDTAIETERLKNKNE